MLGLSLGTKGTRTIATTICNETRLQANKCKSALEVCLLNIKESAVNKIHRCFIRVTCGGFHKGGLPKGREVNHPLVYHAYHATKLWGGGG